MFEFVGTLITYAYEVAVIVYVLYVSGLIRFKKEEKAVSTPSAPNPMGGLMDLVGNMMQGMQEMKENKEKNEENTSIPTSSIPTIEEIE